MVLNRNFNRNFYRSLNRNDRSEKKNQFWKKNSGGSSKEQNTAGPKLLSVQ